ncbi:MAG: 50S ribosomal protein L11 methyltransferase [Verrucomicrobiota bacterium]|nr:50S ribosomal protein L11 methyltransferase [Verrucomicrobiota bacterium]
MARHEDALRAIGGDRLVMIETPPRKFVLVEIANVSRRDLRQLRAFGGKAHQLPRDWLARFQRAGKTQPLRIGARLLIAHEMRDDALIIPAGAAFGTGDHATTAMSLRLLERVSRKLPRGWRMLDLGTGSGIFALAAKKFGAGKVIAIDFDARAIATARKNARANKIRGVQFSIADALTFRAHGKFEIASANLYSELLVEVLPRIANRLAPGGHAILSGVLRGQERAVCRAIAKAHLRMLVVRRRGKWIALLVIPSAAA